MVSIVTAVRDIARVREIAAVLVRHGFGEFVARLGLAPASKDSGPASARRSPVSFAERSRLVLEDLGPTFVKLGQLASTRPDLLPEDVISELRKLLDSAPPIPFSSIRSQIELSLGAPIEEIFESFEEKPLAAASIAQVHEACLKTDEGSEHVVVKVQRPGIAKTIASDVEILHTLALLLERAIPETRIYSPVGLIRQFDQAITAELDFVSEGNNARRFALNFANEPKIRFPKIHQKTSSKQVLTLEFLPGVQIHRAVKEGYSGRRVAQRAFSAILKQIYDDGFFHADPHPGNVLVDGTHDDPIISFVDLGMVGRLSPKMRDHTIDVVTSALRQDHEGIADALYAIGTPTRKIDMEAYRAEVAMLCDKYLGKSLRDIEMSAMIRDLVMGATKYGIEIPTDFVMTGKSLMTIEGIGKELDPDFDVYEEARPIFSELLKRRYSPERMGSELLRRIEKLGGAGYKVPQQVEEVLDDLRVGRLQMRTSDTKQSFATECLGRRILAGFLISSQILAGALLVSANRDGPGTALFVAAALTLFLHLIMEFWSSMRRRE
jgi:ubiquinone biosynthesis protein